MNDATIVSDYVGYSEINIEIAPPTAVNSFYSFCAHARREIKTRLSIIAYALASNNFGSDFTITLTVSRTVVIYSV